MHRLKALIWLFLYKRPIMTKRILVALSLYLTLSTVATAQEPKQKVLVMEIKAEIDPRMTRYVKLALEHARAAEADIVIVEMDSYGGVLTDAKEITQMIMDFKKPTWVFINSDAASAGALISIACDSIYMSPGASIGAATVVNGTDGSEAPDKYQSYMRSIMRSTAEENGRDPRIAEAMVDERTVIDSVKQSGKVLTLTTTEAIKLKYCEAKVNSISDILERNKVERYDLETFELGVTEKIIAFVLNPFISGLLILIIIAGIYFEMQAPGMGFPSIAALVALILYLVPYYLNGLAAYWEIIVLFLGLTLIFLEVFVIPGFGVAGIAGTIMTVSSLVLIMLNNDFFNFDFVPFGDVVVAFFATIGGLAGGLLLLFFGGAKLSNTKAFQRIALTDSQNRSEGFTVNFQSETMKGKRGVAHTVLRPSGKIMIDSQIYDAFTRGEYIERGDAIEVIGTEGVTLKVRKT
jgi:membrane-bound serine protease (ClpP class)